MYDPIHVIPRVLTHVQEIGARSAEARARSILTGLQFTDEMIDGPIRRLSGASRAAPRAPPRLSLLSLFFFNSPADD